MRDIETCLQRWGAWARGGLSLGVKALVMFDDGTRASAPAMMNDDEAAAFDPAVAWLKQIDKELYDVLRLHYVYRLSYSAIAKVKGTHKSDVIQRSWRAAAFVNGYLYGFENGYGLAIATVKPKA